MEIIVRISKLITIIISVICFSLVNGQNYNVLNFGAKGDGKTDDSKAFAQAWTATCGGVGDTKTLLIPAGETFLLQPILFQGPCKSSSIKLQLDGNIVAPSDKEGWSNPESGMWISFSNVFGLIIIGSGTVNGRGSSFWEPIASQRPTALHFTKCDNLMVSGITSIDSPKNHISIKGCDTVVISNINLIAPENSPNTDGFDISDSSHINIFGSTIQTGDDCIALNSGSININITKVNCGPGHGISVGSLGAGGGEANVSNVQVAHCTFNKTMNGARIKTYSGGYGYARNITFEDITLIDAKNPIIIDQNYDGYGYARNIIFEDITLIDAKNPIIIDQNYVNIRHLDVAGGSAVAISDIKFIGFRGTTSSEDAITLKCSATTPCKDIVMNEIDIRISDGEKPKVQCQNVEGESSDIVLMRDCYHKNNVSP